MRTTPLHVEEDGELCGVTRIARSGGFPRPWVLIVGSIHGDEPCGHEAIEALVHDSRRGALPLERGTIITVHGNPAASAVHARSSPGGADLNRLFDFRFERELTSDSWREEHYRALALRPLVASVDVALDVHSAKAPTPPFGICTSVAGSLDIAMQLRVPYVTVGWDGPGLVGHQVLLSALTQRGRPGVAVECGGHDDPRTREVADEVVRRFLAVTGALDTSSELAGARPTVLRVRDAIKRPGASFRFERPIAGLERLLPGEVVGSDGNVEVRMRSECYALMPNDTVSVGDDMLYLAGHD